MTDNITPIDKPKCSRCGQFKPAEELNGYDPLLPPGRRFEKAYCKRLAECGSKEAKKRLKETSNKL